MYPRKTPKPEAAFRAAVALALLPSGSLLGAASGFEAYQIDQWMSYEVKGVRIRPQLDINMMYNNNVFSASDVGVIEYVDPRTPTQTNRFTLNPRVADLIGTVSPGVSFQAGSEDENYLNLQYQSDNTRYFDLGVAPAPMHRIQLAGKYDNQSRLRMEGTHSTEFVSSFMGGWVNLGRTLVDRWTHATTGRVTYDSSEKTDVYVSGSRNYLTYEGVNLYGNDGWRGNLGASYKPTDRLSVFVEGGYGLTDFIRGTPALGFIPTSHVYGGFVGVRGQFTERLEGSIGGGYEIREFPDIPGASFSIPAANISVSYAFRETTKFSLAYIRRTDNAAQVARQGVTYATTTFNVQQALGTTGSWLATAGVTYQGGTFDSLTGFGVAYEPIAGTSLRSLSLRTVDYKRDDSMMSLSGGISYMPRHWLRFGLNYSYDNYSVNYADAGLKDVFLPTYDAHRVMVGVQIGY